ncbi:hypothetical protein ASG87_10570 [Frateuria sp. Soil773]|uniref:TonB-dependent receptor n=1 Tax=Frateuria sp. Soil773 TaxID=1736407 RepID=UPI0006F98967|nr:TonB-dependent receptor [Frateuria sp. Soil773]KRF01941.1 hypothetical protein ASG87_10570 [Frateuria sp. Soil773]
MRVRRQGSVSDLRKITFAVALALGLGSGNALAQSNATGVIFGQAAPGATVHIENTGTGLKRDLTVDASGRYRAAALPIGVYKVTLLQNGSTVGERDNVQTQISQGTEVSFAAPNAANAQNLGAVEVVGNALPAIDVSSVDSRTVVSADQLAKLPIARTSISSIALLAPGTTPAARGYGNALSFGGSSAAENAYYVNGFSVTNPLTGVSSRQLPYDAIDQEQVLIGGYGAEYGRSTGGVINVVTKRGSNQWKGDIQAFWSPSKLAQEPRSIYRVSDTSQKGTLYQKGNTWAPRDNGGMQYSGSIGGPLVKDKLYFFAAADWIHSSGQITGPSDSVIRNLPVLSGNQDNITNKTTRWLTKLDWNINDSNILEFTGIGDTESTDSQIYQYDYATGQGPYLGHQYTKNYNGTQTNGTPGGHVYIANYTGYITDNLTVTAMYGKSNSDHQQTVTGGSGAPCPSISDSRVGYSQQGCTVGSATVLMPGSKDRTNGWNFNIEYRLGDHVLKAGMDNYVLRATWGASPVGGTGYIYSDVGDGSVIRQRLINLGLDPGLYNPSQFPGGWYVESTGLTTGTSARTNQRSQFVEDHWQINDRWLGYIGLRNEQFTNYNGVGVPYASSRHQLDPRLGLTWDVYGDSTLKIYANAARYHLGLPTSVAIRGAGPSLFPSQYFGFTGIDPTTGVPTGLINTSASGVYYVNNENGVPPDGKTVAAQKLHSYYQDEYILGFDKQLDGNWTVGAKAMYRRLRSLIDDTCDAAPLQAWGDSHGLGAQVAAGIARSTGCWLYNPGRANTFTLSPAPGEYLSVPLNAAAIGEPKPKRSYYMLDLYALHQFSDNWYGKVEYTFSRSYGNSEGQLDSDIVQADVSTTESWDFPQIMENTNGPLASDQTHQLRITGTWTPTPEWSLSTVTRIASGYPISCLGVRPLSAGGDPYNYNPNYFWCDGKPSPRGSLGRTPWTYTIDLSGAWKPAFLDHRLTLTADVFNLLGKQRVTQEYEGGELSNGSVHPDFRIARSYQDPRYVRLGARYDFSL